MDTVVVRIGLSEEDWAMRCIRIAAKKHTKMSNAKNWLRDQHGVMCDSTVLKHFNPNLR